MKGTGNREQGTVGRWLLRLYPRAWRERYAEEFLALVQARGPSLRDLIDIAGAALDARLRPQQWMAETAREGQLALHAGAGGGAISAPGTTTAGRHPALERRFSRRAFLRNAVLGGAGVAAAGVAASAVRFSWPNETGVFGKEVTVARDLIPAIGAPPSKIVAGKFWLVNNADGVLALYWKCPHLGCTVPWNEGEGQFHCPCHQSQYNRFGERVAGPAPRPMDLMALTFDAKGNAIVHTGQITEREEYDPAQAAPLPPG